jgi:hypothetical protein
VTGPSLLAIAAHVIATADMEIITDDEIREWMMKNQPPTGEE